MIKNKPKLFHVPIEPLEERYTAQWYKHFPMEFKKEFDVQVIEGEALTNKIETGAFLDLNSTIHYKSSQIQKISKLFYDKKVKDNDIFFIADIEFWGIESIRVMADLAGIRVKIYGFLHAGSYTPGDFVEPLAKWQKFTELGWVLSCNKIFVATEFHKQLFMQKRAKLAGPSDQFAIRDKIEVVGNPLFMDEYKPYDIQKQNNILCTNRPDSEKMVDVTLKIFEELKKDHPEWNFIVTTGREYYRSNDPEIEALAKRLEKAGVIQIKSNLSKDEYHKELQKAKVVVTNNEISESFGYCVVEAANYDAAPISPNTLSHPELLEEDPALLYADYEDCKKKIAQAMLNPREYKHLTDKYESSKVIQKMMNIMKDKIMNNSKYKMEVFCTLQIDGTHRWNDCPIEEMKILKSDHRHMFGIKAYKNVYHDDRDVEFIQLKHQILDYMKQTYYDGEKRTHYFGSMSCEMIAVELIDFFGLTRCEVNEDGENGAIVSV